MSWQELTASLVQSLAWPLVVLVLAIVLKSSIIDLVLRLKRIKHKDTELEFDAQVTKIERTVAKSDTGNESISEQLADLVSVAPRAAVLEAWIGLESLVFRKARATGKPEDTQKRNSFNTVIHSLYRDRILDPKTTRAIIEMRDLRNRVAHSEETEIDQEAAKRYAKLAAELSMALK